MDFNSATATIAGWRSGTLPVQAGGITHANFAAVPATLTGLVPGGPNTVNTYLLRNTFTLTAAQAGHASWEFSVLADDGCVIHVNGVEKGRLNLPVTPTLNPDDLNGGTAGNEDTYTTLAVDLTGMLVAGQNVIAIELHQNTTSSSDTGIDFTMTPAGASPTAGFTGLADAFFGTSNAIYSAQTHAATGGFNATGALRVQMGNVFPTGGSQAVSGAWTRTFTLAAPATVGLGFRHRLISGQDYDNGEYQELICDVDGTQYGTTTAPSTHLAVSYQVGNGNGGGAVDSGWKQSNFNIPLAAGTHTLSLGGFGSVGSSGFAGTAQESFEGFFDDVVLTVPGSVSLLANDTGGVAPVTAVKASDPAHGVATVNANGSFVYTPAANWFGTDTFTYRAVDGSGQSAPGLVTINVTAVNDLPLAVNDGPFITLQDVPLVVAAAQGVLANDSDAESSPLTAVLGTGPANGVLQLNPNGSFTFTPGSGFSGNTSFTYLANDGTANSLSATVTIQVTDVPDAPVASNDSYTALKNTTLVANATTGGTTTEELLPYQSAGWRYFDSMELALLRSGVLGPIRRPRTGKPAPRNLVTGTGMRSPRSPTIRTRSLIPEPPTNSPLLISAAPWRWRIFSISPGSS